MIGRIIAVYVHLIINGFIPTLLYPTQLNRVVQDLTGHCNLQRHKKTTGRAESSLCPNCSLEDETPNHHVGNCKLYPDIRVQYFEFTIPLFTMCGHDLDLQDQDRDLILIFKIIFFVWS